MDKDKSKRSRGRPRTYENLEERRKAQNKRDRARDKLKVTLLSAFPRWRSCAEGEALTDEQFAHRLLDLYEATCIGSAKDAGRMEHPELAYPSPSCSSHKLLLDGHNSETSDDVTSAEERNLPVSEVAEKFVPKKEPTFEKSTSEEGPIDYSCHVAHLNVKTAYVSPEVSIPDRETNGNNTDDSKAVNGYDTRVSTPPILTYCEDKTSGKLAENMISTNSDKLQKPLVKEHNYDLPDMIHNIGGSSKGNNIPSMVDEGTTSCNMQVEGPSQSGYHLNESAMLQVTVSPVPVPVFDELLGSIKDTGETRAMVSTTESATSQSVSARGNNPATVMVPQPPLLGETEVMPNNETAMSTYTPATTSQISDNNYGISGHKATGIQNLYFDIAPVQSQLFDCATTPLTSNILTNMEIEKTTGKESDDCTNEGSTEGAKCTAKTANVIPSATHVRPSNKGDGLFETSSSHPQLSRISQIPTILSDMTGKIQSAQNLTSQLTKSFSYGDPRLFGVPGILSRMSSGITEARKVLYVTPFSAPMWQIKPCSVTTDKEKPGAWPSNLKMTPLSSGESLPEEHRVSPEISVVMRNVSHPSVLSGKQTTSRMVSSTGISRGFVKRKQRKVRQKKFTIIGFPCLNENDQDGVIIETSSKPPQEKIVTTENEPKQDPVPKTINQASEVNGKTQSLARNIDDSCDLFLTLEDIKPGIMTSTTVQKHTEKIPSEVRRRKNAYDGKATDDAKEYTTTKSSDEESSEEDVEIGKLDPTDVDFLESTEFRMAVEDGQVRLRNDKRKNKRKQSNARTRSFTRKLKAEKVNVEDTSDDDLGSESKQKNEDSSTDTCSPGKSFDVASGSDFDLVYSDAQTSFSGSELEFDLEEDKDGCEIELVRKQGENYNLFVSRAYNDWKPHPQDYTGNLKTDRVFPCPKCKKVSKGLRNWKAHYRMRHLSDSETTSNKMGFCDFCNFKILPYEEKFHKLCAASVCKVEGCGKVLSTRREYQIHSHEPKKKRTVEPPADCEVCGKKFKCRKSLSVHMRIHTGVKPYVCFRCGDAFRQKASWNYHMEKHHPEDKDWRSHKLIFSKPYKKRKRKV